MLRRTLLAGLFWSGGAMAAEPPRRRRQSRGRRSPAAGSPAQPSRPPQIDGPPPPSRSGLEPAPVPSTNALPPSADRRPRSSVDFGVPTPPEPNQGQSFGTKDSMSLQDRRASQGQGMRLPSPGATVRVPF